MKEEAGRASVIVLDASLSAGQIRCRHMPEPKILSTRPATLADAELLLGMMEEFYREEHITFELSQARSAVEQLLAEPRFGTILLLQESEQTIGYLVAIYSFILEFGGRQTFLDEFYIREAWRGQGYGRQALAAVETLSNDAGIKVLRLEVACSNTGALALYERVGFEKHDRFTMTKICGEPVE